MNLYISSCSFFIYFWDRLYLCVLSRPNKAKLFSSPAAKDNGSTWSPFSCHIKTQTLVVINQNHLMNIFYLLLTSVLTLFDHSAQYSGYFQHDRRSAAWIDGAMYPAVPVIPIDHIPVYGPTCKMVTEIIWQENSQIDDFIHRLISPGSTLPLITPITLEEFNIFSSLKMSSLTSLYKDTDW